MGYPGEDWFASDVGSGDRAGYDSDDKGSCQRSLFNQDSGSQGPSVSTTTTTTTTGVSILLGRKKDMIGLTNIWDVSNIHRETEEFVKRALSVGVDFITVHGRTRRQKSTEPVNIEGMKLVKEVSTVPVLANGDVFSIENANKIVEATGVDGKNWLSISGETSASPN
jgi:hypothetical protein